MRRATRDGADQFVDLLVFHSCGDAGVESDGVAPHDGRVLFDNGTLHAGAEPVPPVWSVEEDLVPRSDELDGEGRPVGTGNE